MLFRSLYQSLNLRYGSIVDKEGNLVYTPAVVDKMVYAATKVADYDVRVPKLSEEFAKYGIDVSQVIDSIFVDKKANKEATAKVIDDINSMNVISDIKNELKQNLVDIIDMSFDRNQFMQEYDTIKNSPNEFKDKPVYPFGAAEEMAAKVEQVDPENPGKTITRNLEIGQDYFLKRPFTREGNVISVAPTVNILSQTLGGEYEVRMPNGSIQFLTPQEFKQFDLSSAPVDSELLSTTLDNAVKAVLSRKKYVDITVPENTTPLEYVNSLNNNELMNDIEAEFNKATERLVKQREQEEKVAQNTKLIQDALQTQDKSTVQTAEFVKTYQPESKKSNELVGRSTVGAMKGKPHQIRANKFGEDLNRLPNRNNIRGVYVTSKNENDIIPGLIDHLRTDDQGVVDETINRDEVIVLVMTDDQGNLVGVNGEPLARSEEHTSELESH